MAFDLLSYILSYVYYNIQYFFTDVCPLACNPIDIFLKAGYNEPCSDKEVVSFMPKIIEEPRQMILEQAKGIVRSEGMDQLTIRKVASITGISVGTVYNYFPTKRELIVQLTEDYWSAYLSLIDEIDRSYEGVFEKLFQMYRQLQSFIAAFKEGWLKNMSAKQCDKDLLHRKIFYDKMNKKLEVILERAHQREQIHLTMNPYTTANFIVQNFFTMALMNQIHYEDFDKVLRKLFQ
jgi:AcrR family transcriptional regulator